MHLLIGVISLVLLAFLLAEFFIVFLLPRRVRRDPAIARGILRVLWIPWRAGARLMPRGAADTMLGIFGPLGLVAILLLLSSGAIVCFAGLHWAVSTQIVPGVLAPGDGRLASRSTRRLAANRGQAARAHGTARRVAGARRVPA